MFDNVAARTGVEWMEKDKTIRVMLVEASLRYSLSTLTSYSIPDHCSINTFQQRAVVIERSFNGAISPAGIDT